ncbi:hypothetical protein BDZ89DRAFT_1152460 [Hymenopellis radicata]|nr:hypothetical protein BDZ89DRAFT_1152460 [Hymenopellis radicata]
MPVFVRHIDSDDTTAQDVLFLVVLILGVLLVCISIATVVLYCLRRSQKRRERSEKLPIVIPMKFIEEDNKDGSRSEPV